MTILRAKNSRLAIEQEDLKAKLEGSKGQDAEREALRSEFEQALSDQKAREHQKDAEIYRLKAKLQKMDMTMQNMYMHDTKVISDQNQKI